MSYEYAYRRPLLASYKGSIIVSALIMFVGIGTLLFAKHPALRSLGEVTVVGMLSVVLMAYLFPPLMFNGLVRKRGMVRLRPLTVGEMLRIVRRACDLWLGKGKIGKKIETPCVVISNKSNLATVLEVGAMFHKTVIVSSEDKKYSVILRKLLKWRGILILNSSFQEETGDDLRSGINRIDSLMKLVSQGYSVCCFSDFYPMDRDKAEVDSFFVNTTALSSRLGIPIVPVYVSYPGVSHKMERYLSEYEGGILRIGEEYMPDISTSEENECLNGIKCLKNNYFRSLMELQSEADTIDNLISLVSVQYLYKGRNFAREVRKGLISFINESVDHASEVADNERNDEDMIKGAVSLMRALENPWKEVRCEVSDSDSRALLKGCAEGFAPNLRIE